ncbi:MAG: hypothetical protein WKF77_28725 [Planctomycetaceae bacterium]
MGHEDQSMAATYRQNIDDSRLKAVTDYVHDWLLGKTIITTTANQLLQ